MQLDLELAGRLVVLVGPEAPLSRAARRFATQRARVLGLITGPIAASARRDEGTFRRCPEERSGLLRALGPASLVVLVGAEPDIRARVRQVGVDLAVPVAEEQPIAVPGSVTLVGGGPGALGLLTVDACVALRDADVVLVDRLAPGDGIDQLAPSAELVDVGKRPYHHPISQRAIESQMIDRARAGQAVVRLKGGDPYVFGRGGEEVAACLAAGVPVRVIPGVSSAIAVPGAAGIPVTQRGVSRAFTVISGHVPPSAAESEALVRLGGTIVVLMGIENLPQIVAGLARAGADATTPAAIVERGFSESQRTTYAALGSLADEARRLEVRSPAVVVIGEVVSVGAPQQRAAAEYLEELDRYGLDGLGLDGYGAA